jgi:hypothetical protein
MGLHALLHPQLAENLRNSSMTKPNPLGILLHGSTYHGNIGSEHVNPPLQARSIGRVTFPENTVLVDDERRAVAPFQYLVRLAGKILYLTQHHSMGPCWPSSSNFLFV